MFNSLSDCGTEFDLDNGYAMFHDKKTTYKSKVNVGCNAGYNMKGNDFIQCNENGTWTNDTECIIKRKQGVQHRIVLSGQFFRLF